MTIQKIVCEKRLEQHRCVLTSRSRFVSFVRYFTVFLSVLSSPPRRTEKQTCQESPLSQTVNYNFSEYDFKYNRLIYNTPFYKTPNKP